jgi:hypothetical protein
MKLYQEFSLSSFYNLYLCPLSNIQTIVLFANSYLFYYLQVILLVAESFLREWAVLGNALYVSNTSSYLIFEPHQHDFQFQANFTKDG